MIRVRDGCSVAFDGRGDSPVVNFLTRNLTSSNVVSINKCCERASF